jgi:hypothetical protein
LLHFVLVGVISWIILFGRVRRRSTKSYELTRTKAPKEIEFGHALFKTGLNSLRRYAATKQSSSQEFSQKPPAPEQKRANSCLSAKSITTRERCTMFQLFDLIMTSPVGVFVAGAAQDVIYAALVVSDCEECGFNDLGKLLFGGLALAILVGIAVSIFVWKRREKQPQDSEFVSLRSRPGNE